MQCAWAWREQSLQVQVQAPMARELAPACFLSLHHELGAGADGLGAICTAQAQVQPPVARVLFPAGLASFKLESTPQQALGRSELLSLHPEPQRLHCLNKLRHANSISFHGTPVHASGCVGQGQCACTGAAAHGQGALPGRLCELLVGARRGGPGGAGEVPGSCPGLPLDPPGPGHLPAQPGRVHGARRQVPAPGHQVWAVLCNWVLTSSWPGYTSMGPTTQRFVHLCVKQLPTPNWTCCRHWSGLLQVWGQTALAQLHVCVCAPVGSGSGVSPCT